MNKYKVEEMLPLALQGLQDESNCLIAKHGEIDKNFRGQISAFGAAVTMGSFKSAVAFFGKQGSSEVDRKELIRLMDYIRSGGKTWREIGTIVSGILTESNETVLADTEEDYINASIAVKLAMNAFHLE